MNFDHDLFVLVFGGDTDDSVNLQSLAVGHRLLTDGEYGLLQQPFYEGLLHGRHPHILHSPPMLKVNQIMVQYSVLYSKWVFFLISIKGIVLLLIFKGVDF